VASLPQSGLKVPWSFSISEGEFLLERSTGLEISKYLPKYFDGSYSFYDEDEFMRLNTLNYDVSKAKYQSYSLKLVNNFERNFRRFFVDSVHLRLDKRTGNKKLETFLFADLGDKTCRICQWFNDVVPTEFKFVKTRHKSYFLYAKIPKGFVGVKYTNRRTKSVYLLPKKIALDHDFGKGLGLFASDGNKTCCLGMRNTDLFLVKQMRKFYSMLNVTGKRLEITKCKSRLKQKWREQFCFQFENRVLRVFLNNLHVTLLKEMLTDFDKLEDLAKGYVQGFHAGDGHCADNGISFASYKNDPALDFIVEIIGELGGHLGHNEIRGDCRMIRFYGLSNMLVFYCHNLVWHPAKLKKLKNSLKNFQIYVQLEKEFLDRLGVKNMRKILNCHERTAYRYLEMTSYLPLWKVIKICKHLGVGPEELENHVKSIKTSKESLYGGPAKEAFLIFHKLGDEA